MFVEKPMALCSRDAGAMVASARSARVVLMVGTMKRYDPAYERLAELLPTLGDLRLIRVTTLESPLAPYVAHYPLIVGPPLDEDVLAGLREASSAPSTQPSGMPTSRPVTAIAGSCWTTWCTR